MGRIVKPFVIFSFVHVIVTLSCAAYAMAVGSARFDNPELPKTLNESAASAAANVLMLPGRLVWTSWASKNLSNSVEWFVLVANSGLWGATGAAVTMRMHWRRHGKSLRAAHHEQ